MKTLIEAIKTNERALNLMADYTYAAESVGKDHRFLKLMDISQRQLLDEIDVCWCNGFDLMHCIGYAKVNSKRYSKLIRVYDNPANKSYRHKLLDYIFRTTNLLDITLFIKSETSEGLHSIILYIECKQDKSGYYYQAHDCLHYRNSMYKITKPTINKAFKFGCTNVHHIYKQGTWSATACVRLRVNDAITETIEFINIKK